MSRKGNGRDELDRLRARLASTLPNLPNLQPLAPPPRTNSSEVWSYEEREHHRIERSMWKASLRLSVLVLIGAIASAVFTLWGASEARRQADIARENLIATTRAWLLFEVDPKPSYFVF